MCPTDGIRSNRISYEYKGYNYNKGLLDRFLDLDNKWIKIPDADQAGQFYADCKTSILVSGWGDFQYMNEEDIDAQEEIEGVAFSKTFYFKETGDSLTLIIVENEDSYSIPLEKVDVLTGDLGETVDYMDTLWEYEFAE